MFVVSEAEAAAIRVLYEQRGELPAAIELCRRFPGITDNTQARECARTIAGWQPLRLVKRMPRCRAQNTEVDEQTREIRLRVERKCGQISHRTRMAKAF